MSQITDQILSEKQWEVWEALENDPGAHEILLGGAAGGGKSWLLCFWQIYRRCKHAGTRGLIGRYSYTDLEDTTMKTFVAVWNEYGRFNPYGVKMRQVGHVARFSNGSEILFRWLKPVSDQSGKKNNTNLGSLELTDAAVDEVTEVPQKTIELLNSRIRFKLVDGIPKLAMSCNPSICWVKWKYVKTKSGQPVVLLPYQRFIRFGVFDNPDQQFAQQYAMQLRKLQGADRLRLLNGDWDAVDNEDPWFFSFNYSEHTVPGQYKPDPFFPIYLSFDFNVKPMTCTAGQYTPDRGLVVFRSHENVGNTAMLCEKILAYRYQDHPAGLIVTGDVSGKAKHTAAGLGRHGEVSTDYGVIKEAFGLSDMQIRHTGRQNPRLRYSRRVVNHALAQNVTTIYREDCGPLLEDLGAAMPGPEDRIIKTDDNQMNHADNFRYLVHLVFPKGFPDINKAAELLNFTESTGQPPVTITPISQPALPRSEGNPLTRRHPIQQRRKI